VLSSRPRRMVGNVPIHILCDLLMPHTLKYKSQRGHILVHKVQLSTVQDLRTITHQAPCSKDLKVAKGTGISTTMDNVTGVSLPTDMTLLSLKSTFLWNINLTSRHVIWVGEVVTTVARPGTVMINDIQVHISVSIEFVVSNDQVAPSTITYSTTQVSTRTRTETATVTSGLNLSRPPTASPSAALDPSAFNSTSLNSTGVNATVSDVELEHKLKRRLKALLA
jgi:hypothetical protein